MVAMSLMLSPASMGQTLNLETWRTDDESIWRERILPVFTRQRPSIRIQTRATPAVDYDAQLQSRLERGVAGDLITCRPFDRSIELYEQGHLIDITHQDELRMFRSHSKIAWTTHYADRVFCMPVAAVTMGFFYNVNIFKELGLSVPKTEDELWQVLDKLQNSGKYLPLAFGTKDAWQAAQVLLAGVGPNHWEGEKGRINLLSGRARFTDPGFVSAWRALQRLGRYLPPQHAEVGEEEARRLFLEGKAAIYPAGSWELRFLASGPRSPSWGVFPPPPVRGQHNCHVLNHLDMGIGINIRSEHRKQAMDFLGWLSTAEFSGVMANAMNGFFPLSSHAVEIDNPLGKEMISWRQLCDTTVRINSQFLNQAWPDLEQALWRTSVRVLRQQLTPEEAASQIAQGIEKWYRPL